MQLVLFWCRPCSSFASSVMFPQTVSDVLTQRNGDQSHPDRKSTTRNKTSISFDPIPKHKELSLSPKESVKHIFRLSPHWVNSPVPHFAPFPTDHCPVSPHETWNYYLHVCAALCFTMYLPVCTHDCWALPVVSRKGHLLHCLLDFNNLFHLKVSPWVLQSFAQVGSISYLRYLHISHKGSTKQIHKTNRLRVQDLLGKIGSSYVFLDLAALFKSTIFPRTELPKVAILCPSLLEVSKMSENLFFRHFRQTLPNFQKSEKLKFAETRSLDVAARCLLLWKHENGNLGVLLPPKTPQQSKKTLQHHPPPHEHYLFGVLGSGVPLLVIVFSSLPVFQGCSAEIVWKLVGLLRETLNCPPHFSPLFCMQIWLTPPTSAQCPHHTPIFHFMSSKIPRTRAKPRGLVALYHARRMRFGYGFESCDANGPRNVKSTNPAKHRPVFLPPLLLVGRKDVVLKVPKRGQFHAAIRMAIWGCDSCAQGALGRRTVSRRNFCDAESLSKRCGETCH